MERVPRHRGPLAGGAAGVKPYRPPRSLRACQARLRRVGDRGARGLRKPHCQKGRCALCLSTGVEGQMIYNNSGTWVAFDGLYWDDGSLSLGVGTTNPGSTLDVNGDIGTYGTLQIYSDEKIKENILPLDGCLSKLAMINGKSYYKKVRPEYMTKKSSLSKALSDTTYLKQTETDKQLEIGLIAQEVETVFPELVKTDKNGLLSVNYIGLIPVLIESIKEQQKQIGNLTNQLKSISSQSSKAPSFAPIKQPNSLDETLPASLYQNNPNPFSQFTEIKYYLPETVNKALLCIYDLQGKQLKQITIAERGEGSQTINGAEFSAGIYLYGLIADGQQVDVRRMVLTD